MARKPAHSLREPHRPSLDLEPTTGVLSIDVGVMVQVPLTQAERAVLMKQCFASLPENQQAFFLERGILWGDW